MTQDEEFVREHWKHISYHEPFVRIDQIEADHYDDRTCVGWEDAAAFTRERLEQIRQLEADVALVDGIFKSAVRIVKGQINYDHYISFVPEQVVECVRLQRILAREQAVLSDLKRGMIGGDDGKREG